jgi:class 3 adenylate cyclase
VHAKTRAAVNEVCRLEPLCKLGLAIVMSDRFRAHVHDDDIVDLGERALRGVAAPVRVHGIGGAPGQ